MIEAVDNSLVIVPDDNYLVQGIVEEDGTIEITKCYEGDNNIVNSDYKADYFKIKNGSYNVIHGGSSLLDGGIDVFALVGIGNASDNFLYGDEGIDLFVVDSDGSNTIVGGSGDDIYNIGWVSGKMSEVLGSQKMELVIDQAGAASTDKDSLTIRNVDYGFVDSSIGSLTMSDFSTMKDIDGNYIIEDKYGAKVVIKNNANKSISKIVFEGFDSGNVEIGIEEIVVYVVNSTNTRSYNLTASADVVILNGSNATVKLGAGNDTIDITGSGNTVFGDAGNDILNITGSNNLVRGGYGSDTYNIIWTPGNSLRINMSDKNAGDSDVLNFVNVKSTEMTYEYNKNNDSLVLTDANGRNGTVTMFNWSKNPLGKIKFTDITLTGAQLEAYASVQMISSSNASLVSSSNSSLTNPLSRLNTAAISFASDSSIGSMNYSDVNSNENNKTQFFAQS